MIILIFVSSHMQSFRSARLWVPAVVQRLINVLAMQKHFFCFESINVFKTF